MRGGEGVSARPPPGRTKTFVFAVWGAFLLLFFHGEALCYVFLLMISFFHRMEAFCYFFLRGGYFATSSSWCAAFFTMWGPFLLFSSPSGGLFCLHGGFYVFMVFFIGLPLPPMIFLRAHAIM